MDQQVVTGSQVFLSSFRIDSFDLICFRVSNFSSRFPFNKCIYLKSFSLLIFSHHVKWLLSNSFLHELMQYSGFILLFVLKFDFRLFISHLKLKRSCWSSKEIFDTSYLIPAKTDFCFTRFLKELVLISLIDFSDRKNT